PDEHISHTHLTAAIALAMVRSETLHERAREVHLAVQKDALVRNEHILENGHDLLTAKDRIAHIQLVALQLSGVAGLPAVDVPHPAGSGRDSAAYRPGFLARAKGHGGH